MAVPVWAQPPAKSALIGQFLDDSLEIGRPFRYALTYRHPPTVEVLFPDTAIHFLPFRVKAVSVSPTHTTGEGPATISRDSAVYTLISFETDSAQLLQVPIRLLNATDCTSLMTQIDTVFLRSKLTSPAAGTASPKSLTLAFETRLARLQQQFNYPLLVEALILVGAFLTLINLVFGQAIRRQWRIYQLAQRHRRFLRDYTALSQHLSVSTASDTANQVVVLWKTYLEQLENQPYASLTTPEIAERTGDDRVTDALREADRMIYGETFSDQSPDALRVLRDVAILAYHRRRSLMLTSSVTDAPAALSGEPESSTSP
ncbi:hypothetical protein GK091_02855 [Spirosoma agri]|uniref:Uncharacterized protein n=1 Tax=Spirosoma agri TaxID=1987381 RepID=A0A6M0IDI1_9BACT|nr:hypothetical protein [Spirosoma agri]NEU65805.1 hypothetical protein [Spirosoma agri]